MKTISSYSNVKNYNLLKKIKMMEIEVNYLCPYYKDNDILNL